MLALYLGAVTSLIHLLPIYSELMVCLATALIMVGGQTSSLANRVFASRSLVYVGTVSYSLYLLHFWIPSPFAGTLPVFDFTSGMVFALNFLLALFIAIAVATGVYQLVEIPGRRLLRRWADFLLFPAATGSHQATKTS